MKQTLRMAMMCASALIATPIFAEDLTIGARTEIVMDPHFSWSDANTSYYVQIYGALVHTDENAQLIPGLADEWKTVSDTEWHFHLRPDVTFHDGSELTSADVVASFDRALTLPNAANPYSGALTGVKAVRAVDDLTVSVTTEKPDPIIPYRVAQVQIIPAEIAETATTEDFNAGSVIVGSGPYRFESYQAGDNLVLSRNDSYAGAPAEWDRVTFRFIPDDAARVAALLGGDVDLIDYVPPSFVQRLRDSDATNVITAPSDRVIYLIMDTERDSTPFVHAKDGSELAENPFKDPRVREALTISIDRGAIVDRVMDGLAFPAGQLTPEGFGGFNPGIPVPSTDVDRARQLLADAGYAEGFAVTLHCTNDRYVNDARVCQALGQMLSRLGLDVDVQTMPRSVFFPRAADHEGERFSLLMLGWGSSTSGEADALPQGIHSYDPERGLGIWNLGHYSNPKADALIEDAMVETDIPERHRILSEAMEIVMEDYAVIPLHYQSVIVATRSGLSYRPWASERTIANSAIPVSD
ncbi:ABC transporter substrate-binding protein [Roseovarius atlanticus]|uniref:ABC transporter substrate-binding protein n=1 Tax=Roseovarius atlanticus TaxID=1641875 RepID=UPI001C97BF77|nr:ABC transporter substrate-binding protein [Roseovarius atlanticus]MBY6124551.1 ABC transporter substrate-binding protein [Roseovarius atlanticus]MBY6149046.1 ABC transporter substrate-binding protein [Roseovarius atlanticus]